MKGLILCGGTGTRLRPYSHSRPKQLLPVANQPVVQYAIDKMKKAGIYEIGIVVSPYFRKQFEEVLGKTQKNMNLHFIEQHAASGLADAVRVSRSFIKDESFMLFLGDNFYAGELDYLVRRFQMERPESLLLVSHVPNPSQFGVVQFEGTRIIRLIEKPKKPPSSYAIVGIYLFTPAIFEMIEQLAPSVRGEYEITDAIQGLIDKGYTVLSAPTESWWKDTGQTKDLLACNRHVLLDLRGENYPSNVTLESSTIEGPVVIQEGAIVIDSIIRGPVVIGSDTKIIRSYIGPFSSIGNSVLIEDSEIENSIVLEKTSIIKISKRIDESIIGGQVRMEGLRGYPRSLRLNLGDHSELYLPLDDE